MAGEFVIRSEPADSPAAAAMLTAYYAELARRFPGGFDPGQYLAADVADVTPPAGDLLVIAAPDGVLVGCGAVRRLDDGIAEIKRMWVADSARGHGLGRRLLLALEERAAALGCSEVRLDTSAHLPEAMALYRSAGYAEIAAYNDNRYAAHWFAKRLS